MGTLVGRVGSTRASCITYLIPVVSLTLGSTFRGDTVAPIAVVGIALVIGGAVLASRGSRWPHPLVVGRGRSWSIVVKKHVMSPRLQPARGGTGKSVIE